MKTTIEEGDEPKIEEKENEETKKNISKLLRGCRCRHWRFLRFSCLRTFCETGTHSANCVVGVRDAAVYGGVYGEVAALPRLFRSSRSSGVERQPAQLDRRHEPLTKTTTTQQ